MSHNDHQGQEFSDLSVFLSSLSQLQPEDVSSVDLDKFIALLDLKVESQKDACVFREAYNTLMQLHKFVQMGVFARIPKSKLESRYKITYKILISGNNNNVIISIPDSGGGGKKPPSKTTTSGSGNHFGKWWTFLIALLSKLFLWK